MPLALGGLALLLVVLGSSRRSSSNISGATYSPPPVLSCSTRYTAHLRDGRARQPPRLIVIHSTEGDTAAGAAGWFTNPDSEGSAHVVVGEDGCYRTLPDGANAAGAGNVNPYALHIEFAGFAARDRSWWLGRARSLSRGASQIAEWSRLYGIPLRRLTVGEIRAGMPGIATHKDVNAVFGGSHWDPGPGFPLDVVIERARAINAPLIA